MRPLRIPLAANPRLMGIREPLESERWKEADESFQHYTSTLDPEKGREQLEKWAECRRGLIRESNA